MSDIRYCAESALRVDIADQIIVGFGQDPDFRKLGQTEACARIQQQLASLESVGFRNTVLKVFVVASSEEDVFFAFAVVRLDEGTLAELRGKVAEKDKEGPFRIIEWVERNARVALSDIVPPTKFADPLINQQWALFRLGAAQPWTVKPPGMPNPTRTKVAIVDSGLLRPDGSVHEDLGLVEPSVGIDLEGHGTFLAGTIAAVPNNTPNPKGIASAIPQDWNISLMPVQFFTPPDGPDAVGAAAGIAMAAAGGAKVINASWHVSADQGLLTLKNAIKAVMANHLVVVAAGNDGTDNEIYPTYPASFAADPAIAGHVLVVLATGRDDSKAFFSNYGKNTVDLGAPGLRILTTARYLVDPARYAEYSGTSAAAAYTSAGAALVFALNPGWSPRRVIRHLKASADIVETLKLACIDGKRLNLKRAVYGPLHVTAPAHGDVLNQGAPNNIAWSNEYTNPDFAQVKIEFSHDDGVTYTTILTAATNNDGLFVCPAGSLQATAKGRIRITPTNGNFPAHSRRFKVV